ncbi:hypothetical protein T4D_2503, partial [Trichinella pseudospiralis]
MQIYIPLLCVLLLGFSFNSCGLAVCVVSAVAFFMRLRSWNNVANGFLICILKKSEYKIYMKTVMASAL